jgi:hypothetical protein
MGLFKRKLSFSQGPQCPIIRAKLKNATRILIFQMIFLLKNIMKNELNDYFFKKKNLHFLGSILFLKFQKIFGSNFVVYLVHPLALIRRIIPNR